MGKNEPFPPPADPPPSIDWIEWMLVGLFVVLGGAAISAIALFS